MKRFYSYSFGCRVNQAEKEELDRQLMALGYQYSEQKPDYFIINTCSVTHKAEREAKQLIYQVKRNKPATKIVVTGCAATNWIKQGIQLKEVDLIVDNQSKEYIASLIQSRDSNNATIVRSTIGALKPVAVNDKYLNSGRIILKIQDGCHRFCSFCIVPYLRGLPKSTRTDELIKQINSLDPSIQEVILSAINTQAYGYDTQEKFTDLIESVLSQTAVRRLSFGSIHPWSFDDNFFKFYEKYADSNRFVHFFHIPLQSGSNKVLNLMKRGYTREEFIKKLQKIAQLNPFAYIGTDVIVGYLDENDEDFEDTYNFLEETPISKMHIFRFSKREHTAAYYMAKRLNEPTPQEKQKRAKALASLNEKKQAVFMQKHVNNTFEALFLEQRDGDIQDAVLQNQVPIKIKTGKDLRGSIQNIKVIEYKNKYLFGTIV